MATSVEGFSRAAWIRRNLASCVDLVVEEMLCLVIAPKRVGLCCMFQARILGVKMLASCHFIDVG